MLAQNFKTAAELDLTEIDRGALVTVLGMLERGEIESHRFTMATVGTCGTPGCILGWAHHISGGTAFPGTFGNLLGATDRINKAATELFMLEYDVAKCRNIGPERAAMALRNYLTTGEARWREVLEPHGMGRPQQRGRLHLYAGRTARFAGHSRAVGNGWIEHR